MSTYLGCDGAGSAGYDVSSGSESDGVRLGHVQDLARIRARAELIDIGKHDRCGSARWGCIDHCNTRLPHLWRSRTVARARGAITRAFVVATVRLAFLLAG